MNAAQRRKKRRARRATFTVGCEVRHKWGCGDIFILGVDPKDRKRMICTHLRGDFNQSIPVMRLRLVKP